MSAVVGRIWALTGSILLLLIAGLAGVAVALLPLQSAILLLGLISLAVLVFIEPIGAVVLLLITAPLKALIETEAPASLPGDIGQLALIGLLLVWVVTRVASGQELRLPLSKVQVPVALFVGAAALSIPGAVAPGNALAEASKWVAILLLISLCLDLFRRDNAGWLVCAMVLTGGVQALVGLYEFFGGSGVEHLRILDDTHFRAFGTFGQPNPFGAFMGITLAMAAGAALGYLFELRRVFQYRQGFKKVAPLHVFGFTFYAATAALILAGLLASWSRGAWMGFVVSAGVMVFFIPRSLIRSVLLVAILVPLTVIAWSNGWIPESISGRLIGFSEELVTVTDVRGVELTDSNYAVTERIAHWQSALEMAREHPWLGVGFDNYEQAYFAYALMEWQNPLGHAHNYYLNLLAETGIIGLSAYLLAWVAIFALTIRQWRRSYGIERGWCVGLLGVWTYIAVHSLVDKLYVNNIFLHVGCLLGLLAVLWSLNNQVEA
ncbi:MAG: O-antigen ligase family protein [Anaerolineae bacterium]|nr:O-antigen ligase family protein [Anaerolineae bacterium]